MATVRKLRCDYGISQAGRRLHKHSMYAKLPPAWSTSVMKMDASSQTCGPLVVGLKLADLRFVISHVIWICAMHIDARVHNFTFIIISHRLINRISWQKDVCYIVELALSRAMSPENNWHRKRGSLNNSYALPKPMRPWYVLKMHIDMLLYITT